jgi:hypothetical protein
LLLISCSRQGGINGGGGVSSPPDTTWTRTFGGSLPDQGEYVCQTNDLGFIIAGGTDSYGSGISLGDAWLVKTDSTGIMQWNQHFGGPYTDWFSSVQVTQDGGYIATGKLGINYVQISGIWLLKTDGLGNQEWSKSYSWIGQEEGQSVALTSDGGYIVLGTSPVYLPDEIQRTWMVKTDANGDSLWSCTLGGIENVYCRKILQASDDGFVVAGSTWQADLDNKKLLLLKTNVDGSLLWSKEFSIHPCTEGYDLQQTLDNGFIIAGLTYDNPYYSENIHLCVIKTDGYGNEIWQAVYNPEVGFFSVSIRQTQAGGYILASSAGGFGEDGLLLKIDGSGGVIWQKLLNQLGSEIAECVVQTLDGGYVITGSTCLFSSTNPDLWLVRLAADN